MQPLVEQPICPCATRHNCITHSLRLKYKRLASSSSSRVELRLYTAQQPTKWPRVLSSRFPEDVATRAVQHTHAHSYERRLRLAAMTLSVLDDFSTDPLIVFLRGTSVRHDHSTVFGTQVKNNTHFHILRPWMACQLFAASTEIFNAH